MSLYPESEALMMDPTSGYTDPTVLYRFFDMHGGLLYVGICNVFETRDITHMVHSPWRWMAEFVRLELFPSRRLAECAEAHAIAKETPIHNVKTPFAHDPATVPNRWFLSKMGGLKGEYVRWFLLDDLPVYEPAFPPLWWDESRIFALPYTGKPVKLKVKKRKENPSPFDQVDLRR